MHNEYNEFYASYFQQIFMTLIFCATDEATRQLRFAGADKCRDFGAFEDTDLLKASFPCVLPRKASFLHCFLYASKSCSNASLSDSHDRGYQMAKTCICSLGLFERHTMRFHYSIHDFRKHGWLLLLEKHQGPLGFPVLR